MLEQIPGVLDLIFPAWRDALGAVVVISLLVLLVNRLLFREGGEGD